MSDFEVSSYEDICLYLRVCEADLSKNDLFVQSRLKPAWRASRAEKLVKLGLYVQSRLKLAWRASRAENLLIFDLCLQLPWCQAVLSALKKVA